MKMAPTFDVLVVGAGPAGLAAAARSAENGARVGLVDDNPGPGGQIWRGAPVDDHRSHAGYWLRRAAAAHIQLLPQTRVLASMGQGALLAEDPRSARELRFNRLIVATGPRERFLPFPGWTLPGVMGAGGLQALVKGGLSIDGKRVVVAGTGPLLLAVASYLKERGAAVLLIAEQASWARLSAFAVRLPRHVAKVGQAGQLGWSLRRIPFRAASWVIQAHGTDTLQAVTVHQPRGARRYACDYLACGFGLVPNLELPALLGCRVADGAVAVDEWQRSSLPDVSCAGEATGVGGLEACLVEGQIAGLAATGRARDARALFAERARAHRFASLLERTFEPRGALRFLPEHQTVVCRCEDVAYGDLYRHASWRAAKLHTRCGMGPCQGRICGPATAYLFGWRPEGIRPPVTPARLGSLAHPETVDDVQEDGV